MRKGAARSEKGVLLTLPSERFASASPTHEEGKENARRAEENRPYFSDEGVAASFAIVEQKKN